MNRLMILCAGAALLLTPVAASVAEPILSQSRTAAETPRLRMADSGRTQAAEAQPATAAPRAACTRKVVRVVGAGYGEPVLPACPDQATTQGR